MLYARYVLFVAEMFMMLWCGMDMVTAKTVGECLFNLFGMVVFAILGFHSSREIRRLKQKEEN